MTHGKETLQILEENQSVARHHLSILEFSISARLVSLLFDRWLVERLAKRTAVTRREKSLWEKDDVLDILSCVPRNTPLLVNL